ncbi:hypothetical protein P170DRAFT_437127 [Aspergillus steynii IBT 23096]|uniref:S-adenosyl-L-methionine-dependent methyltransferase n=1 Tax=Aspergillus steynii IBT 23096 TaxID=1392250 RepID=A0A2I2G9J0_9EURO|nr:uncharacterized protein P170DRAFT_437127 [Aspergillus steynii IBT 23096]PLB49547.1 hypothetical protein P170DRAFT_437127 [Aspergillus steynii IBT 23096]
MPRLSSAFIAKTYRQHPFLPLLLRECRTIESARNELRWLTERATVLSAKKKATHGLTIPRWKKLLWSMCRARSRGVPLQYILGDQPFGDLEILCRRGVLIPRVETETFTMRTAKLILEKTRSNQHTGESAKKDHIRIMDLCTGSGCISLLLHALLSRYLQQVSIVGIDVSPIAIGLANSNLLHNLRLGSISERAGQDVYFREGNVLFPGNGRTPSVEDALRGISAFSCQGKLRCDVVVANPPYIAPVSFWDGTTARSVRMFEPSLALVPPAMSRASTIDTIRQEDIFFHYIIGLALGVQAKLTVLECGSLVQAQRVAVMCKDMASGSQRDQVISVDMWSSEGSFIEGGGPYAVVMLLGIGDWCPNND